MLPERLFYRRCGIHQSSEHVLASLECASVDHMSPRIRSSMKHLLIESPFNCAWVVTGSAMAMAWANLVTAETNGHSLLTHCRRVGIAPTVSADVMGRTWAQLQDTFNDLPPAIIEYSPPHPATLSYLCTEWAAYTGTDNAEVFCTRILNSKIFSEVTFCPLGFASPNCCCSIPREIHQSHFYCHGPTRCRWWRIGGRC